MGKSARSTTSADRTTTSGGQSGNTGPDAATQDRINQIWQATQNSAGGGAPSSVTGAQGYYGGATAAGQQGIAALGGDTAATQKFMNPYQQQVVDAAMKNFGVQNQATEQQMNDAATRAGAFGGSRHGVATGVALGENQRNQGAQIASLLQGGYTDAMGRAGQLAGLGMDAAGAGANLGMIAGSPALWQANVLKQGFSGLPYGTTYDSRNNQATSHIGTKLDLAAKANVPFFG